MTVEFPAGDNDPVAAHVGDAVGGFKRNEVIRRIAGDGREEVAALDHDGVAVRFPGGAVGGLKGVFAVVGSVVALREDQAVAVQYGGARSPVEVELRHFFS